MPSLKVTPEPPDLVLVDLARQGDNDSFGELVRRHYLRCIQLASSILRNHWDAEDRVQVALLKAHMHLSQYQGEAEFATWLFRIVVNECLMFMRERRRAQFMYLDDTSRESRAYPLELPERGPDPEREVASSEFKQVLRTEIRHVPPLLRNAIMLHYFQELAMSAVAEALQISVPAAKSRLLRALIELRLRLRQHRDKIGTHSPQSRSVASLKRMTHHSGRRATPKMLSNPLASSPPSTNV